MVLRRRSVLLVATAAVLTGCMPPYEDIGRMVLIEAPLWYVLGLGALLIVAVAWRPLHVTVLLFAWRLWLSMSRSASYTWAPIVVLAWLWIPALILGLGLLIEELGFAVVNYLAFGIYPGLYGIPTVIAILILVAEARIRLWRAQRRRGVTVPAE